MSKNNSWNKPLTERRNACVQGVVCLLFHFTSLSKFTSTCITLCKNIWSRANTLYDQYEFPHSSLNTFTMWNTEWHDRMFTYLGAHACVCRWTSGGGGSGLAPVMPRLKHLIFDSLLLVQDCLSYYAVTLRRMYRFESDFVRTRYAFWLSQRADAMQFISLL